jgi:galactitol-specific phosphotransferase system IIC component
VNLIKGTAVCAIMLMIAVFVVSCSTAMSSPNTAAKTDVGNNVIFWHDDARNVSCWILDAGNESGISCLPDVQVQGLR